MLMATSNNTLIPIGDLPDCVNGYINDVPVYVKVTAAITCFLSLVGSFCIIFSFICYKRLRNRTREIIVNISLMDFMVSMANLIGIAVNFNSLLQHDDEASPSDYDANINNLCIAQAAFAMLGTLGSITWTVALSVQFYVCIMVDANQKLTRKLLIIFYVVCYGLPLLMLTWFLATEKIGHSPIAGSGWCSLIIVQKIDGVIIRNNFNLVFGNSLWIFTSFIIIPIIAISLFSYLKFTVEEESESFNRNLIRKVEIKLIIIPVIFVLLRIWSELLAVITVHGNVKSCELILFLSVLGGIGDSGQGFFNALIFGLFNSNVRKACLRLMKKITALRISKIFSINRINKESDQFIVSF